MTERNDCHEEIYCSKKNDSQRQSKLCYVLRYALQTPSLYVSVQKRKNRINPTKGIHIALFRRHRKKMQQRR